MLDGVLHSAHPREVGLGVTEGVELPELFGCRRAERSLQIGEVATEKVDARRRRGIEHASDSRVLHGREDDGREPRGIRD